MADSYFFGFSHLSQCFAIGNWIFYSKYFFKVWTFIHFELKLVMKHLFFTINTYFLYHIFAWIFEHHYCNFRYSIFHGCYTVRYDYGSTDVSVCLEFIKKKCHNTVYVGRAPDACFTFPRERRGARLIRVGGKRTIKTVISWGEASSKVWTLTRSWETW